MAEELHAEGLALANDMFGQMQGLAQAIVKALEDGKIDSREGIRLGVRGLPLVEHILDLFDETDAEARADFLYVLQHGAWTLTD